MDISIDDDPYLLRDPEEIVFGTIEIFASRDMIEELSIARSSESNSKWMSYSEIHWSEEPQTECQQEIYDFIDDRIDNGFISCNNATRWMFDGDAFIERADGFELVLGFDSDVICLGSDCCSEVKYFVYDEENDQEIEDEAILCGATAAQIANAVFDLFLMEHPGIPEETVTDENPLESLAKTAAERRRHHLNRKNQATDKLHIPNAQVPESARHGGSGKAHPNDVILGTYDFEVPFILRF